ncbi:class I poly(R)-hydroxyalkanoic acid synthase [Massilia sp. Dwa41.01b]|uniref:class I poly(R)-hydroxyalkanoic acid synthase n=1 Tax=unclassified Massilia TaxID=2609279 RepID=UPI0016022A6B|nr:MULTISPECIES: class I poly(R)-hydroxyalkanoic acid synthase [unclassified Massilia]QNA88899.1 class I poly(R)-hydroxyalkanoic acid synthase [Massilia sp. Dwa41.01b]QNA99790.1 class I poly(R)-hydroxyalkanoic acid synthase [Massilia sp. Se16.2.3]
MNMPDPQAVAATWMNQFTDPAAWQGWLKMPAVEGFNGTAANPLAGVLKDFNVGIAPQRVEELRNDYLQKAARLWQDLMSGKTPALHDKRFSSSEWTANPFPAFTAASYLLNADFLLALSDAVEAGPRERQKIRFAVQQMVDAMSPANFLATNPEVQAKILETKGESLTKGLQNMLADMQKGRISQSDESAFEVGVNVGTTPGQVVYENELFQLIQYSPATPTVRAVPLLMIPPCINKFYILDLQPDNSLVRYVVEQGNTVFMVSWRNPDKSMGALTWDDYVERGAIEAIGVVREISGQDKAHVFGFCVGGTIAATALSVLAARGQQPAASLSLLTTLLDFSDTGVLEVFVDEAQVALREQNLAKGGIMPGRDLATTFSALRPNDLVWNYVQQNYLKGKTPPAFDLLYWNADSTNLPGPMFCWYLRNTYLENKLKVPGKLTVCGVPVDLGRIDCPVFIYGSKEDHIVPWQAAFASMNLLNPKKAKANRFVLGASGHIAGVINPAAKNKRSYWVNDKNGKSRARTAEDWFAGAVEQKGSWWPEWARFLQENGGAEVPAPSQPGNEQYLPSEPAPGRYVKARAD